MMVDKLRAELLALGYRRHEVDSLMNRLGKERDIGRISPEQHRILFITLQEMLEFSRAAAYQRKQGK